MIPSYLSIPSKQYSRCSTALFDFIISHFEPIISLNFEKNKENLCKKKIKIGIIGAGIGGCSTAFFLEDVIGKDEYIDLEIDIIERETDIGGSFESKFISNNECQYNLNPIYINFSQIYMKHFYDSCDKEGSSENFISYLIGLFDLNGNIWHRKVLDIFSLCNMKFMLENFGCLLKIFKFFVSYLYRKSNFYMIQNQGQCFDNIEKLLRKIDPNLFTLSQHSIREILMKEKLNNNLIDKITSLACMNSLNQHSDIHAIAGISALMEYFFSYELEIDSKKICKYLLENCKSTRLMLNSHAKLVSYDKYEPDVKNTITYIKNNKEIEKSYDYVVITFPLTKQIKKQNFWLDILYRDFLDYEINYSNTIIVDGRLNKKFFHTSEYSNKLIKLYSSEFQPKIKSIKTILPVKSQLLKNGIGKVLYSVVLSNNNNRSVKDEKLNLEKIFKKGYKIILKESISNAPLFKKAKYTHTPFPNIVIDGIRRKRVFYLNGLEWLECSKESICISARNISYLIAKKEMTKRAYQEINETNTKKFNPNFLIKNMTMFAFTSTLFILYFTKQTLALASNRI